MANADEPKTNTNNGTTETTEDSTEKKVVTPPTKEVEAQIIRQIEYYFGDFNLPKDKFLQEQITLDDGWVPISVLLTFKRLLAICPDAETIANTLLNSDHELMMVSEDRTKVRRNPEMPVPEYNDERRKELTSRTAYAKGFPLDSKLEYLMKFFEPYGPFESVLMRTYKDKATKEQVFKGSVFVIFKDVDTCKKFMELEEVKHEDTVLIRKWQSDYMDEKKLEREERFNKKGKNKNSEETTKKPYSFPKGAILHMSGFKDDTTREKIKEKVLEIGSVEPAFVTFDKGDSEGYLRFTDEGAAIEFVKKLTDSKFKIGETEIVVRALEGEEEEKFLAELSVTLTKIRSQNRQSGKGKGRKRKGGGDYHGPRAKQERK